MSMPIVHAPIDALLVGKVVPYTREGSFSAIAKKIVVGPVHVGPFGIEGDEHGDPQVHGGPDKAVHHYPYDHYTAWRAELGDHALLAAPGAFGENLSTSGVTETDLCLGDRLSLGSVVLEISQPRQPCWKLADRFGLPHMARRVQDTARTGWYYRVLEPGEIAVGDRLTLVERRFPHWPIRKLIDLLYKRGLDQELLRDATTLPLPDSWLKLIEGRLSRGTLEDWSSRLDGPAKAR